MMVSTMILPNDGLRYTSQYITGIPNGKTPTGPFVRVARNIMIPAAINDNIDALPDCRVVYSIATAAMSNIAIVLSSRLLG